MTDHEHISEHEDPYAELDPKVRALLNAFQIEQKKLQEPDGDICDDLTLASRMGCGDLNSVLYHAELTQYPMFVYGKLRLAPWLDNDERVEVARDSLFRDKSLTPQKDERGEYWQLTGQPLYMCPVDTDQSTEESMLISYVMTFRTVEMAQDIEDEDSDPGYRGVFIMYPDDLEKDVEAIRPNVPSQEYAVKMLQMHYPDT